MPNPLPTPCAAAREQITARQLSPNVAITPAARAHLAACADCAAWNTAELAFDDRIRHALRSELQSAAPLPELETRIMAALAAEPLPQRPQTIPWARLAVAASLLAVFSLIIWLAAASNQRDIAQLPPTAPVTLQPKPAGAAPAAPPSASLVQFNLPSLALRFDALPPARMLSETQSEARLAAQRLFSPLGAAQRAATPPLLPSLPAWPVFTLESVS